MLKFIDEMLAASDRVKIKKATGMLLSISQVTRLLWAMKKIPPLDEYRSGLPKRALTMTGEEEEELTFPLSA